MRRSYENFHWETTRITLHSFDDSKSSYYINGQWNVGSRNSIGLFLGLANFLADLKMCLKNYDENIFLRVEYPPSEDLVIPNLTDSMLKESIKFERLKSVLPHDLIIEIAEAAQDFGITNNLRLAHFLGQCAVESNGFHDTVEGMNYRTVAGLKAHFTIFRKGKYEPEDYVIKKKSLVQQMKLGSLVYASRYGNGDVESGDGWKYGDAVIFN